MLLLADSWFDFDIVGCYEYNPQSLHVIKLTDLDEGDDARAFYKEL